jgi:hypothetical protein
VWIDCTDPVGVPDEVRLSRAPDGPRLPGSDPPSLSDPAERDAIRRAYKDRVDAVYADHSQGTSDTPDKPAISGRASWHEAPRTPRVLGAAGESSLNRHTERPEMTVQPPADGSWSRGETLHLSPEQDTEAAIARGDSPHKGERSLYCPVSELKGDEPGTAKRLMESGEFTGVTLQGFKDPTDNPDYIDEYKRTYDTVGGPSAWAAPELNMNDMINQIKRHLYQKVGVDFTVLDLTSASSHQIGEVFENLDMWSANPGMRPLSKLIILGDG